MKSILLHVHDDDGLTARLDAALDLARAHRGHLTCLQSMPFAAYAGEPFTGAVLPYEAYVEAMKATREKVEKRLGKEDVPWDWIDTRGDGSLALLLHSQLSDVIVVSPPGRAFDPIATTPMVAEIAIRARTPMLVIPNGQRGLEAGGPILAAWNGSPEAAQAIRSCRSLLRASSAVHIVCVEEDADKHLPAADAASYLSRHGIAAEVHARSGGGAKAQDVIRGVAAEVDARMIVMGAYGHSRLYEFVLGGVTRSMLRDCPMPLVLAH